jgi:hypothetical protein
LLSYSVRQRKSNPDMSDDELTSLTLRLPTSLRERIESQAKLEDRTASQFVRYHLGQVLVAASADSDSNEEGDA